MTQVMTPTLLRTSLDGLNRSDRNDKVRTSEGNQPARQRYGGSPIDREVSEPVNAQSNSPDRGDGERRSKLAGTSVGDLRYFFAALMRVQAMWFFLAAFPSFVLEAALACRFPARESR